MSEVKISFLGDISFNDYYIDLYKKGINPFKTLQPLLESSDFVIGNLECIAKGEQGENTLKKPRLTTSVETLNYLNTINANIVSLAQNHVFDHLEDGFLKTTSFLNENNIQFLGASLNKSAAEKPIIISKNEINIGLLNYVTQDTNPNLPEDASVYLNYFDTDRATTEIKLLKEKTDYVILLLHWGGRVEGGLYPDWRQPKVARNLIDAGADLIIGHHSHTIQPYEVYKGKYIFYSLGNFCFSNLQFEGKVSHMPKRRRITLIPSILFNKGSYTISLNYFYNKISLFKRIQYGNKHISRNIKFKIVNNINPIWYFYYFFLKKILPIIIFFNRRDISFKSKISRFTKSLKKRIK